MSNWENRKAPRLDHSRGAKGYHAQTIMQEDRITTPNNWNSPIAYTSCVPYAKGIHKRQFTLQQDQLHQRSYPR